MQTKPELIYTPEVPTMVVRTTSPVDKLPVVLGECYDKVMAYLSSQNEQPTGAPFVIYHNLNMQALDLEAGFPSTHALSGAGDVKPSVLPAGQMISSEYTGTYQDMPPAYDSMTALAKEKHVELSGMAIEIYLNDPTDTPPDKLKTHILLPVKVK